MRVLGLCKRGALLLVVLSACSSPQPAPTPGLPYASSFEQAGNWTQTKNRQADIYVEAGQLHIIVKQAETLAWSTAGLVVEDFVMEVDATLLSGPDDNGYGIIVRRVDDDNFYSLQVSSDGYFIVQKRVEGKWVALTGDWQAAPPVQPGRARNRLRVVGQGKSLSFAVNGTPLAQVTDGDFARGDVGLIAGSLVEPGVHVAFDNVSVTRAE